MSNANPKHPARHTTKFHDSKQGAWCLISISDEDQVKWETLRSTWAEMDQGQITETQSEITKDLSVFFGDENIDSMACLDFIYIFNETENRQLFVPTSGEDHVAMFYSCPSAKGVGVKFTHASTYHELKWLQWELCNNNGQAVWG